MHKHNTSVQFWYGNEDEARVQVLPGQPRQVAVKFHDVLAPGLTMFIEVDAIDGLVRVLNDAKRQALHGPPQ